MAGYDELSIPQLRGRLRSLSLEQVEALVGYERANLARPPYLTMLENRLTTLRSLSAQPDQSRSSPWPVRTVAMKIAEWVARLGEVWVEGQVTQLDRRGGATAFLTLRDPAADVSVPGDLPR